MANSQPVKKYETGVEAPNSVSLLIVLIILFAPENPTIWKEFNRKESTRQLELLRVGIKNGGMVISDRVDGGASGVKTECESEAESDNEDEKAKAMVRAMLRTNKGVKTEDDSETESDNDDEKPKAMAMAKAIVIL
uniref:Uncharacterized protein n=1 Tax=Oryza glumipatula TaxID=40148 RepID=A0A0E0AI00_9ORYZ